MSDQVLKESLFLTMKELYRQKILTDVGGNLSFRSSEEPDNFFWITPSGMKKDLVEPRHLIKMSMEGEVIAKDSKSFPSVEWPMHLRAYREDEDFKFVIHSHAPLATAYSVLVDPPVIPPLTAELGLLVPSIVLVPYKRSGSDELGEAVAEALWDSQILVLANHGVLAVSEDSFQNAVMKTRALEESLQLYLDARKFGGELRPFPGFD